INSHNQGIAELLSHPLQSISEVRGVNRVIQCTQNCTSRQTAFGQVGTYEWSKGISSRTICPNADQNDLPPGSEVPAAEFKNGAAQCLDCERLVHVNAMFL
ncbi:MAG: hypothetical protein K0R39_715, partial [Symbiobacteriaceae bacterium]|nr:hypothetical protein [Symbiobacteriaceae bacterium]